MSASAEFTQTHPVVDFWIELIHFFGEILRDRTCLTPNLGEIFLI
jgi:hypothetical protein